MRRANPWAVGGAVLAALLAVQLGLLAWEKNSPEQFRTPDTPVPTAPTAPARHSPTTPAPSTTPRPEVLPLNKDGLYWNLMDRTEEMIAMYRDQPLHADEEYNQAFLYLLTDQMGGLRIAGQETGTREERAAVICRFTREINQLEDRYTAGEPLGTDVHIRRPDGSEFTYDGRTAPQRS